MFVRIKRIKGNRYAYLVENCWTPKGSRQKTKAYLGRLFQLEKVKDIDFSHFVKKKYALSLEQYIETTTAQQIIKDLLLVELMKHGFTETLSATVVTKDRMIVDLEKIRIFKNNPDVDMEVVLKLNQEYMAEYTIKRLLALKLQGDEDVCGKKLAEAIVGAGIAVDSEIFIALFEKSYRDDQLVIQ